MQVSSIMVRNVVTIEAGGSTRQAAKLMDERGISSLLVVSEGKLIGIVTEKDLVVRLLARGLSPDKTLVEEVMSYPVITTGPDADLEEATKKMLVNGIKKLPVVEDGHVVGILSLTDVAKTYPAVYSALQKIVQETKKAAAPNFYIS
jgi:CBS domain-containing protein